MKKRYSIMQENYIEQMIKSLPALRTVVGLTQAQLGKKLGMSRQTIVAIENRKRPLPWYLYLAMVCIFQQYAESKILLESLKIFDIEFFQRNV